MALHQRDELLGGFLPASRTIVQRAVFETCCFYFFNVLTNLACILMAVPFMAGICAVQTSQGVQVK
jgi:hypothetical protein